MAASLSLGKRTAAVLEMGIRFPVFIVTYLYLSACYFTSVFQITTKLAAVIFRGALYGGGVLPAQYYPCDCGASYSATCRAYVIVDGKVIKMERLNQLEIRRN